MKRIAITSLATASLVLPGCIVVGDYSGSDYNGYGSVTRNELNRIVAANTQNHIGQDQATVLARYPAQNVSLIQSTIDQQGEEIAVYRVYARTHSHSSTRFERFLVFKNGSLVLLTDDRDDIERNEDDED